MSNFYRKKREIIIPEDRTLTPKQYYSYSKYAYNSSLWFFQKYQYNSFQIRKKLLFKGFIEEDVYVKFSDNKIETFNIIDIVVEKLIKENFLNDKEICLNIIEQKLYDGYGINKIKSTLYQKFFPADMIEECLENFSSINEDEEEISDGLKKSLHSVISSASFKKLDKFKQKQKIFQKLSYRGFVYSDINKAIDLYFKEEEE